MNSHGAKVGRVLQESVDRPSPTLTHRNWISGASMSTTPAFGETSQDVKSASPPKETAAVETQEDHHLKETVYTPASSLREPGKLLREMFDDLKRSRELSWRLFIRDLRARHRRSLLGYIWVVVPPIASTLLFVFLQSQKILNVDDVGVPYSVYVFTGLVLWQTFTASINSPLQTGTESASILTRIHFPRSAIILTGGYHILFNLSIKLVLLAGVFVFFGIQPTWMLALFPIGVLSIILLGYLIGLVLMPFGMLYQDIRKGLGLGLTVWMLVTPVVYSPPTTWPASIVVEWNPVSPLLVTAREMATTGNLTTAVPFLCVLIACLLLLVPAWVLYYVSMPHIIARIGS